MALFRPQRGSLDDAMKEVVTVNSKQDLADHINASIGYCLGGQILPEDLESKHYTYDDRINWDTWIWKLDGFGVIGFTNSSLTEDS